jgi:hypothetical protein
MPYGNMVPFQFQQLSRYSSHCFRVTEAWWRPYRFGWTSTGQPCEFPRAAFCRVEHQGELLDSLFPEAGDSGVFESVLLLAAANQARTRTEKFLTPYRALESLAQHPTLEMRAIRHSLAHSTSQLRDPKVTDALRRMFSGVSINFRKHSHKREFYRWLGDLLVLLDCSLADALLNRRDQWLSVRRDSLLAPWEEEALNLDHV